MPSSDEVPVFYREQNDVCEPAAFIWPRTQCRERKKILGNFFDSGKKFRLFALRPKIYPVTAADLHASNFLPQATSITNSELLANVGIAGQERETPAPRHVVRRAQQKIRAYPSVRDQQAVTAFGRWFDLSAIQVSVVQ